MIQIPPDFKEFLKLLNEHKIKYLIIGGFAVAFHGYPRTTGDLDIWIEINPDNAEELVHVLNEFGFDMPDVKKDIFLEEDKIVRMGFPPMRIEIFTSATGVDFKKCYKDRVIEEVEGVKLSFISLECLRKNKRACSRYRDLDDLEHLQD
ncbi:hypothetical protein JXI42_03315 [bacterium]|nr:hypothetical protein [bacterium]